MVWYFGIVWILIFIVISCVWFFLLLSRFIFVGMVRFLIIMRFGVVFVIVVCVLVFEVMVC